MNSLNKLEKDLVPLIDIDRVPSYQIDLNNEWILEGTRRLEILIKRGFEEPNQILNAFKKYNFLFDTSLNQVPPNF